jgi:heme-degrading monooxygenase HmoA
MYVNVFRSRKRADMDVAAYAADAARMDALARAQKGFLAFRTYRAEDGETLSMSEWETEADAQAWRRHAEHAMVQARGRQDYYESYTTYSCIDPVIRHFDRSQD